MLDHVKRWARETTSREENLAFGGYQNRFFWWRLVMVWSG